MRLFDMDLFTTFVFFFKEKGGLKIVVFSLIVFQA